jgi:hypothetical protein
MQDIPALRARLAQIFPGAAGFRTDYTRSDDGRSRRALVIESFDSKPVYVVVSEYPATRARSLSQIKGRYCLVAEIADEALAIANTLADANDYTAWPTRTQPSPARIVTPDGIAGKPFSEMPGMGGHYRRLRGLLEATDHIERVSVTGRTQTKTRTKEWLTFRRADGTIQAEVAHHLMSPALRQFYTATEEEAQNLAQARLSRWTRQLGISFRALLAVLPEIEVLTNLARATEIRFER